MNPSLRTCAFLSFSLFTILAHQEASAQLETRVPTSVSTNVGEFTTTAGVSNITLGITALTDSTTTFPYEVTSQFTSPGIGYIAQYGFFSGILTFNYPQAVSISHLLVWNAYFTIELDHSINQVELSFFDGGNNLLTTVSAAVPMAAIGDETAYSVDLGTNIPGVAKVEMNVVSLHGGNDISVRRIAFAGLSDPESVESLIAGITGPLFPCPAVDGVTIPARGVKEVVLLDASGRLVPTAQRITQERVELGWQGLAAGTYIARLRTTDRWTNAVVLVQ